MLPLNHMSPSSVLGKLIWDKNTAFETLSLLFVSFYGLEGNWLPDDLAISPSRSIQVTGKNVKQLIIAHAYQLCAILQGKKISVHRVFLIGQ